MNTNNTTGALLHLSETMRLEHAASEIFPLLCPVREYDWIEEWDCEMIHSESGFNELGCVFKTNYNPERGDQYWVTCKWEPNEAVGFVCNNDMHTIRFTIDLHESNGATELHWRQEIVFKNEEAISKLKHEMAPNYKSVISRLEKQLDYFLLNGEMLRQATV